MLPIVRDGLFRPARSCAPTWADAGGQFLQLMFVEYLKGWAVRGSPFSA